MTSPAMTHAQMLALRQCLSQSCAGGTDSETSHRMANAALKSLRHVSTRGDGADWAVYIDLSEQDDLPIIPWEYVDEKGPKGCWGGKVFSWSWRRYLARMDRGL